MKIDVHSHYYPAEYLDLLDRHGGTPAGTASARQVFGGDSAEEVEARLAEMVRVGIGLQVLSAPAHVGYFPNPADAIACARLGNDLYAEMVSAHPGRFLALGTVPLPHVDAAVEELGRCLDELHLPGIALSSSIAGRSIADGEFEPLYRELDRRGAVLLLHPEMAGAHCPLVNDIDLTRLIGWAIEDAVALLALYRRGILERYRSIRIVSVHLGGFLPFVLSALDDRAQRAAPELAPPSEALRRVFYDTATNTHPHALRMLIEVMGAERVVLGTDYPYNHGERLSHEVGGIESSGLSEEQVHAIFEDNARSLLGAAADVLA